MICFGYTELVSDPPIWPVGKIFLKKFSDRLTSKYTQNGDSVGFLCFADEK